MAAVGVRCARMLSLSRENRSDAVAFSATFDAGKGLRQLGRQRDFAD
jgi:hypothetical protein